MSKWRRRPDLAPGLVERVLAGGEENLGTYPDPVLAVTGSYPVRGTYDYRPESAADEPAVGYFNLDAQGRRQAMQGALDSLVSSQVLDLESGTSLDQAVKAGLQGKLGLHGPLQSLNQICTWFHRHGYPVGLLMATWLQDPGGDKATPINGCAETGYALAAGASGEPLMLVERLDPAAGARSFVLRSPRAQLGRACRFLFTEHPPPVQETAMSADFLCRATSRFVELKLLLVRQPSEDRAHGGIASGARKADPRLLAVDAEQFMEVTEKLWETSWNSAR